MFRPRCTIFFSLMAISSLVLTGCPGNANSTTNGVKGTNGSTTTTLTGGNPNVIKIVSSFPRTGSAKQQTDTIVNGIKMVSLALISFVIFCSCSAILTILP